MAKWLDSATYKYSAECASSYVSLGTEHRWCEDPIESAPFIRDRAPMVQRTLLNLLRLLLLLLFFFFSKLNRILEGLNMLEKSGNFAHASELVKIYI